jgi:NAD(P)-dependent dehydrogenase (short-subunit alcohol dehydrogenase family)
MREKGSLAGATAIVTRASSGIGYGIASRLAADGAAVAINYHSSSASQLSSLGARSSAAAVEQLLLVAMSRRKPTWRRSSIEPSRHSGGSTF